MEETILFLDEGCNCGRIHQLYFAPAAIYSHYYSREAAKLQENKKSGMLEMC